MDHVKQIYLKAYLGVMALYVFLNKGIAYTYLVEALWLMGLFIIFLNRKSFELILNKKNQATFIFPRNQFSLYLKSCWNLFVV